MYTDNRKVRGYRLLLIFPGRVVLLQSVRTFKVTWIKQRSFTQVIVQFAADGRVTQTVQGLGFDLADALTRHAHLAPNFLQCVGLPIEQAIAQLQDTHFAGWQSV